VDTIREVYDISIKKIKFEKSEFDFPKLEIKEYGGGDIIEIRVIGKSFLYHQIRWMIGYLVQVGSGKIMEIGKIEKENRLLAPPNGLYLYKVNYQ
jgi:tRNA pseudouridine(38-40) synthase